MDALDRINKNKKNGFYKYYGYALISTLGDSRKAIYVSDTPYEIGNKELKKCNKRCVKVFGLKKI